MHELLLFLHLTTLSGLLLFAAHRVKLMVLYARHARHRPAPPPAWPVPPPTVCLQLPVFNEPLVVEGLLAKVAAIRWPAERLQIQLLDDSTDHTPEIAARWLAAHPEAAARIQHIRRTDRRGYKAGALSHGNTLTGAEFIAIFDADFLPEPDFLEKLMPHFADPRVGVVQARWEFANRRASLLTRFQGVFLDAHFVVEQAARHGAGLFFNFNGTAGIWRRAALDDAGGWSDDTVTEDLDLSYRAQLRGWRFVYRGDYTVPSELPENITAFKSQQRRWTKGGIQVARKQLGLVLSSDQPARVKREASWHLLVGCVHPLLVAFSLLLVPYLVVVGPAQQGWFWMVLNPLNLLLLGGGSVAFYVTGQYFRAREWREGLLWLALAPFVMSFGLAMSVTCSIAVLEGLLTRGGEFVRTPKGGRSADSRGLVRHLRSRGLFAGVTLAEFLLGALLLWGTAYWAQRESPFLAGALGLKAAGFLLMAALSSRDLLPRRAAAEAKAPPAVPA
jgi:cellulose synthase/poly-beta-1,6-N-acetylglucosamine synthase-like glycosyltransferase